MSDVFSTIHSSPVSAFHVGVISSVALHGRVNCLCRVGAPHAHLACLLRLCVCSASRSNRLPPRLRVALTYRHASASLCLAVARAPLLMHLVIHLVRQIASPPLTPEAADARTSSRVPVNVCFSLYSALILCLYVRAAVLVHGCYLQADLRLARTADRPRFPLVIESELRLLTPLQLAP